MEEIVLTSDTHALTLRNKGYRFKHIKYAEPKEEIKDEVGELHD